MSKAVFSIKDIHQYEKTHYSGVFLTAKMLVYIWDSLA
jgi:hypothetical protein